MGGVERAFDRRAAGRCGFGRDLSLHKPQEFSEVFSSRCTCRGDFFFVLHWKENGKGFARLGLVISKKHARSAVLRNAIKRQAREAFRLRREELPALDLVLRVARPVPKLEKKRWRAEIEALLGRVAVVAGTAQQSERPA